MKRRLSLALLAFALAAPSADAMTYTSVLSFPSAPVAALADFPVLVRISATSPSGFSYADCPDASHLWFADDGGTPLPFEVDTWDATGTSLVWVSVPALSNATTISMNWADNAVWHFNGSNAESVTNLAATANGSPSYDGNASYPGPLGKTLWLNGSSHLYFANDPSWATIGADSTLTISCWARATAAGYARMISTMSNWKNAAGYELTLQGSYTKITVGSSGTVSNGSQFQTDIATGPDAAWKHFTATYAGTTATLYVDGASAKSAALNPVVAPTERLAIGSASGTNGENLWKGGLDEVRIRAAASTADWIAAEYATMTSATFVSCGAATTDPTAPTIATPVASRGATGTFTVSAALSRNIPVSVDCIADGGVTNAMSTADAALPMTYTAALSGLAADTTYACTVAATSTGGSVVKKACPTAFYNGDLSIAKVSDANEKGLVPGSFRISRADTAHDLAVAYAVGGTATAGQTYAVLSGTATIPAGAASVDIPVVPLADVQTSSNTTVTVTLAAGLYGIDAAAGSATLTISNNRIASPADFSAKVPFTVSGYTGESTLENFPVLVRLSTAISGFSYGDFDDPNGADLLFMDAEGNAIPHEIETWDPAGESLVWVRVPALSGTATTFTMYFGSDDPGLGSTENVWSRYAVVVHGGDSLTNAVAGGPAVTAGSASVAANANAGKIGGGVRKSDYNSIGLNAANVASRLSDTGKFSVSAWFKRDAGSGNGTGTHVLGASRPGWNDGSGFLWLNEQDKYIAIAAPNAHQWSDGNGKLAEDEWAHVAFAYESGASLTSYFNGAQDNRKTASLGNLVNSSGTWTFGSYANTASADSFKGAMDELRIFNGVASADWIKAEYDSTVDPAFAVAGAVGPADPTAPVLDAPTFVRNADGTYTVTVVLAENSGTVGVIYDAGATAVTNVIEAAATPGTYTDTPANLASGTTYRVLAYGKGANGTKVVEKGGVIYNGALAFGAATNADEASLAAGGVVVSRAAADPWPLAVAYTIAGPVGSAGVTWVAPEPVEIPAGAASATLPVVPLRDDAINADIALTVALAAGNYGVPAPNAASLTLVNRRVFVPLDFAKKIVATPSAAALAKIGDSTWADFPVLVRLPAEASALLQSPDGTDLLVTDENGAALPFEVETFDPAGTTFVWVKVPSLSAATELTVHFGGDTNTDNAPTSVWSRYVGVWHFDAAAAGTTVVSDATGHALDGTTTGSLTAVDGPFGDQCLGSSAAVNAPDYEPRFSVGASFTASGWFKLPSKNTGSSDYVSFAKKKGGTWNAANGWYLEMDQGSKATLKVILTGTTPTATIKDVAQNWQWFQIVSDGSTVKVYVDGVQKISYDYKIVANAEPYLISTAKGQSDEYRLRKSVASAAETALEYATMSDDAFFDYGAIADMDPTAPAVGIPVVARDAATGAFTVTALVSENVPTAVFCDADGVTNAMATADAELPMTYSATLSGLAADTTYACAVGAGSTGGTTTTKTCPTAFYNGDLSVERISDAVENGLVPGVFRITRADTAHDLVVSYTVGGTAIEGQTYEALSGTATIPAGSNSVDIAVAPLIDAQTTSNTIVSVTLAAGLYGVDAQAGSAELTVVNLVAPVGYNVWVAPSAGLASVGSNWSEGHCPTASENVLFDGRFSTADCEWDSDASAAVASWTQAADYTGTVTVDTVFPEKGAFTCLAVSGDMAVAGGKVTHKAHDSTHKEDYYRLRLDVGGDLSVASGASIHATGKGAYGPHSGTGDGAYGGCYNGNLSWGSLTEPYGVGSSPAADGTYNAPAGGAIWIEVAGSTQVDGSIRSDSVYGWGQWNGYSGSGGAVYLKTKNLSGTGFVSADCVNTSAGSNNNSGAGGRVSILLTEGELDSFPDANLTALAGKASYGRTGGTGTVLVRSPLKVNGVLYLRDRSDKYGQYSYRPGPSELTRIPANQTWILDEIVFGKNAILQVPTGTTLDLRGGLASVSSTATSLDESGLLVDGGTLLLPNAATHTVSGTWIFEPTDFALTGSLVVTNGAGVGTLLLYSDTSNSVRTCGLSVSGDMHVASGAYLRAVRGGYTATGASTVGGDVRGCHGGQSTDSTENHAYDSFFHPRHPGAFGSDNGLLTVGGGAIRLAVGGTLTLDGVATASPPTPSARCGAAGSIDITAARLEGVGRIEANGNSRNYISDFSGYGSGGGRIAVRLTGAGATVSDAWLAKINATGFYSSKVLADHSSSAGSIYLQTGRQAEGTGTILVRNTGDTANDIAFTPIPSTKAGGENDSFKKASLRLEAAARVKLFADLRMEELFATAGTALDLNGNVYAVKTAHVDGLNVGPGTYTAAQLQARGFAGLVDTADGAGGTLVVHGSGTILILR